MIRKPMLPGILMAVLIFGTTFLAVFRSGIERDRAELNGLYDNTHVTMELIGASEAEPMYLRPHKELLVKAMPEVIDTLVVMKCPYVLGTQAEALRQVAELLDTATSTQEVYDENGELIDEIVEVEDLMALNSIHMETDMLYATNDPAWLEEYWQMTISWAEGWDAESFVTQGDVYPCLVRQELMDAEGIALGQTITITPAIREGEVEPLAPNLQFVAVGSYRDVEGMTDLRSLILPEYCFLNGPEVMYQADMSNEFLHYVNYVINLDPAYNREYNRIQDQVKQILYDIEGRYTILTNANAMQNAARPLERKLELQSALVLPLGALFAVAAVVAAVLLCLSFETEIFLRLLWGESRSGVLLRLLGTVAVWLAVCAGASVLAAGAVAGRDWLAWAVRYGGTEAALCVLAGGVPMARACGRNLVKSYQSKEGE